MEESLSISLPSRMALRVITRFLWVHQNRLMD
jgi:hypothetical protein